jgi:uncharacterized membrane protein (UPF0127 family)
MFQERWLHSRESKWQLRLLLATLCFSAYFLLTACAQTGEQAEPSANSPQSQLPTITLQAGKNHIHSEVAKTPDQLSRGLMFRTKLGDNDGMLFVLEEGPAQFWMANTGIPLSLAYLDREGKILEIHDLVPYDVHRVNSESQAVAYALEMNKNWFVLNHVGTGETIIPSGTTWKKIREQ